MNDYKELVKRLRDESNCNVLDDVDAAADAIENLLNDIECRKTIAAGLVYLNNELAKTSAEKDEKIRQLQNEIKRLNSENFWLYRGANHEPSFRK